MAFFKLKTSSSDENGEVIPTWKLDAVEGEEPSQFPSIADKIKGMEEEAKKSLAMYEVPDVKSRIKVSGEPAAKWMEARSLILVNSFFVKDLKDYGRVSSGVPDSTQQSDALKIKSSNINTDFSKNNSKNTDILENLQTGNYETNNFEAKTDKITKTYETIELPVLTFSQLGLFCTPVLTFLVFHVLWCILPFVRICMFLIIILTCTCVVVHRE